MPYITTPRIMIAAPGSGSGKTIITCALLRILERRGLKVTSFKCGPDYIDPMFHRSVLGIPSRNLDLFLAGDGGVLRALSKGCRGKDIAVIEGVMGLFDGMSMSSSDNSSYDMALKTGTPIIFVVNCGGMGRSIIPLIKGFAQFGKDKLIKGVILNNTSGKVYEMLKDKILEETGVQAIGFLPKLKDLKIGSRHLGLILPSEIPDLLETVDAVADALLDTLDVDGLLEIAGSAAEISFAKENDIEVQEWEPVRLGIARDEAFCFYYEDNLELLRKMGAELVFFSPIHDRCLPAANGYIFGGGYPELFAKELSANISMLESIKAAADAGIPILAECGGFLYLGRTLRDEAGDEFKMAGIFQMDSYMTGKLSHFGYVNVEALEDTPYLMKGESIRGHEFHYYDTSNNGETCSVMKANGAGRWNGYMSVGNLFGGFAHLYYHSNPEFIKRFFEHLYEN